MTSLKCQHPGLQTQWLCFFHSERDIANEISLDYLGLTIELQKSFTGKTFLNRSKEDKSKKGQTDWSRREIA